MERLNALNTVIEAFGNARTCLNLNATRCTHLVNLDFDQAGQIASLSLQVLMKLRPKVELLASSINCSAYMSFFRC